MGSQEKIPDTREHKIEMWKENFPARDFFRTKLNFERRMNIRLKVSAARISGYCWPPG
jgi:hypothetical protein